MLPYTFYNTDLINIAKGKSELSTGFVDDCTFIAVVETLDDAHSTLKDMMERLSRGLEWSHTHNSPFELTKLAVMDFTRTLCNIASSPLKINKPNTPLPQLAVTVETEYCEMLF